MTSLPTRAQRLCEWARQSAVYNSTCNSLPADRPKPYEARRNNATSPAHPTRVRSTSADAPSRGHAIHQNHLLAVQNCCCEKPSTHCKPSNRNSARQQTPTTLFRTTPPNCWVAGRITNGNKKKRGRMNEINCIRTDLRADANGQAWGCFAC